MSGHEPYMPGPAMRARVEKGGEKWTLILSRELRHAPQKVWQALTDPAHLHEWAPFEADGNLASAGSVKLTWAGTAQVTEARVMRAEAPRVLEFGDLRWELEPTHAGTRLTLWHSIDRRFVAWGAAGWHICLDVLERRLQGEAIARIAGPEAMKVAGWRRLRDEYAEQFGVETRGA
jgi:uncharacterized protein YndB with AHSA1/START domain